MAAPRPTHLAELMDDPSVDPLELAHALKFIRGVNRYLGGTPAVLAHVKRWSGSWKLAENITFLDIATGSADIPIAIAQWASRQRFQTHTIALDLHPATLEIAQSQIRHSPLDIHQCAITLVRGDALNIPLANQSVDYALCSMFLHHLTEPDALRVIREMLRVARRGIVVNDLLRTPFAHYAIRVLTLFSTTIDRHDARLSVAKAWTPGEIRQWPVLLNTPFLRYRGHPFSRFTLATV